MQDFVKERDRAASPQHIQKGSHANPDRRAIAANAKVTIKRGAAAQRSSHSQNISGLPSRGIGNVQNSSAAMQQAPPRRQSGQGQKPDPYDTDAESLDTTINQSFVQAEDVQIKYPQDQRESVVIDLGSEQPGDGDEDSDSDEGGEEDATEDYGEGDGLVFTQEHSDFLQERGLTGLGRLEAANFLAEHFPTGFRTVEGDSYPSTTDGNPTEWDGAPQPTSEDFGNGDPLSPSPRGSGLHGQLPVASLKRRGPRNGESDQHGNTTKMFQRSAHIRDQQRLNTHHNHQPRHELFASSAPEQSSQPPSYSQVKQEYPFAQPVDSRARTNHVAFAQPQKPVPRQFHGSIPAITQSTREVQAPPTFNHPSESRNQTLPTIQHPQGVPKEPAKPVQPAPLQPLEARLDGDYDFERLYTMDYDALKNESFDTNPRAPAQPLSKEMLQKPLIERLTHVQQNFDAGKQSDFFRTLPTNEWEDAGDWFLEQFSSIIKRTKEARQAKRKLAQGFEDDVERRYKHVSKKHNQVQEAMFKMQAQGEGLVPRSPRASKSPKPKKR